MMTNLKKKKNELVVNQNMTKIITNIVIVILLIILISEESPHHSDNHRKNDNFDYNLKDSSNNLSYEEKGVTKIAIDMIVPDYLVSLLIGKKGETIRGIMNKSGSMISFQKEVYNNK